MTGKELKAIREALGLSTWDFATALAHYGKNRDQLIRAMESKKTIPPRTARLALMYSRHGCPPDWTINQLELNSDAS